MVIIMVVSIARHSRPSPTRPQAGNVCSPHRLLKGGRGNGFNINAVLPIQPSPLVGMQGWFDTTCTIRKV
jgi:hypothetical protein